MKLYRIKDNGQRKKEEFHDIPELVKIISDKTLGELEKEGVFVFPEMVRQSEDISQDQMVLQSVNDTYRSGNIMGFLEYGEERLVIASRFSTGDNDFLLWYLLERVLDMPNIVNLDINSSRTNKIISLLIFLFPYYLSIATRKGIFKTYVRNEYNDGNVRGRIDIDRHIRKNIPFVGNIAYSQREYAYDNYLMQLIRHTVEYIKRKSFGKKLLVKVKDEVQQVIAVTPGYEPRNLSKVLTENKKNTVHHAYYHEYRALQRLCILILQNEKVQVGIGNRKIYGILFDGAWLWEEYINLLVRDYFHHPMNKRKTGTQYLFDKSKGEIYPDFIGIRSSELIIADAKYKPVDNVRNADYFQMLAYMFRFDSKRGYYFYPEVNDIEDRKMWLNRGNTYEKNVEKRDDICLIKHGLKIPSEVNDYEEFVEKIRISEKKFVEPFKCLI
ncbi:5-methylcytosine-specific restriction endonuclease McrBC, regulatory subunit McrC [Lachnospiraceae bacterium]|nr:5-methylcytosine-specific restriction endonuclease McrBC, regulatory subunit McrC [Lachnospiraceae bacterium]